MTLRFLLVGILVAFAHVTVAMAEPQAVPLPGKYDGVVRVTQKSDDGLSASVSYRATAAVYEDGTISILTAVPNPPSLAGQLWINKTKILLSDGVYVLDQPPLPSDTSGAQTAQFTSVHPEVVVDGSLLKIRYTTPEGGVINIGNGVYSLVQPMETATVTFTFRKKREERR